MAVAPITAHAASGTITPFWQRIPKFFLFPFHLDPLAYAAFLALVSLLVLPVQRLGHRQQHACKVLMAGIARRQQVGQARCITRIVAPCKPEAQARNLSR